MSRRLARYALLTLFCCSGISTIIVSGQQTQSNSNLSLADVIKMVEVKLADDLIVAQLIRNGKAFSLSVDDMVRLKTAGASDNVIRAMLNPGASAPTPPLGESSASADDRPTEPYAFGQFWRRIWDESEQRIRLASFHKTDGITQTLGIMRYVLTFEAEIEFVQDCKWVLEPYGPLFRTRVPPAGSNDQAWGQFFESSQFPGVMARKGQRARISGALSFVRSEKGWGLSDVNGKVEKFPLEMATQQTSASQGATVSTPSPGAPTSAAPSARPGVSTTFHVSNNTFRSIQLFLDGNPMPIEIKGISNYESQLEVGSSHTMKVEVGAQTFQAQFTVPRVMRRVTVTTTGIVFN